MATAEARPSASVSLFARFFTISTYVSVKPLQKKRSTVSRAEAYSKSSMAFPASATVVASRARKARSSGRVIGVCGPVCDNTNLPALKSFVTRRRPTFRTFSSKAVSVPRRAERDQ